MAVEDVAQDVGVHLASYGVGGATTGYYAFGVIPSLLTQSIDKANGVVLKSALRSEVSQLDTSLLGSMWKGVPIRLA